MRPLTLRAAALAVALFVGMFAAPVSALSTAATTFTSVYVPGTAMGTTTGVFLVDGASARVTATGHAKTSATHGGNGPNGGGSCHADCLAPGLPTYGLVMKVGAGPWQFAGAGPVTATGLGELVFAYNDATWGYADNEGGFTVAIQTGPTIGNDDLERPDADGSVYVIVDTNKPATQAGAITSVRFFAKVAGPLQFVIVDSDRKIKAVSPLYNAASVGTHSAPFLAGISVGDNLGVYYASQSSGRVAFRLFHGAVAYWSFNWVPVVGQSGPPTGSGARTYSMVAAIEADTDGDGLANSADTDDDGDGVADSADAFPLDDTESVDTDGDGTGNRADTDDDGDGVADSADAFPLDDTESVDTDGDGTGNNADTRWWAFSGFKSPVDGAGVLNVTKAGAGIPVKFGLGGDKGMAIFESGYPQIRRIACPSGNTDVVEQTESFNTSGLTYDPASQTYQYNWKTAKTLAGTCQALYLSSGDASAAAKFQLK